MARAGALCAAMSLAGCNAILGIEQPTERKGATEGAGSGAGGSSSSSSSGAGGSSSAGGGREDAIPASDADLLLIDDMEDQNDTIITRSDEENPRQGYWVAANDGYGTQWPPAGPGFYMSPIDPPRGSSHWAAHSRGDDQFIDWGASFAFRLNASRSQTTSGLYDASEFRGITFFARAESGSTMTMSVDVVDKQTWKDGEICHGDRECGDNFRKLVALTPDWVRHEIDFSELVQEGWGLHFDAVDRTQLWGIGFRFGDGEPFDVWIDDVSFLK
ncbi:hypothetical protein [Sorangium sp. So ce1182]|uniref:hypothetical protein n=1 Tax=Sorangium sp. So ce1182 TaxID=3133334 RepID=UPI003F5D6490